MDFKNKKGFITVYVMLAMMFFVAFVVTASVTASRKLKLQTETNTALAEIYSQDIENMNQTEETTIPIYTQKQFLQIANWIYNGQVSDEYMYINDTIYFLDGSEGGNNGKSYSFILKTDLWLGGTNNTDTSETDYPYIPLNEDSTNVHEVLKEFKRRADYKSGHTIYLKVGTETYRYDDVIRVTNAEEFLKIGTANPEDSNPNTIGGYPAYANETYVITRDIDLGSFLRNIYDSSSLEVYNSEENAFYRNLWENRPEFKGKITTSSSNTNTKIISGLYIDLNVYNNINQLRSI